MGMFFVFEPELATREYGISSTMHQQTHVVFFLRLCIDSATRILFPAVTNNVHRPFQVLEWNVPTFARQDRERIGFGVRRARRLDQMFFAQSCPVLVGLHQRARAELGDAADNTPTAQPIDASLVICASDFQRFSAIQNVLQRRLFEY